MVAKAEKPVDLGTAFSRARVPQRGPLVPVPGGTHSTKSLLRRSASSLEQQLEAASNTSCSRKVLSQSALHKKVQREDTNAFASLTS